MLGPCFPGRIPGGLRTIGQTLGFLAKSPQANFNVSITFRLRFEVSLTSRLRFLCGEREVCL